MTVRWEVTMLNGGSVTVWQAPEDPLRPTVEDGFLVFRIAGRVAPTYMVPVHNIALVRSVDSP